MFRGELGENLAVQLDTGFLQLVDKSGIGLVAVVAERGIEAHDPELAEVGLLVAAVSESVAARAHQRLMGGMELLRADAAIALGAFQDIFAALIRMYPTFDSCHT